MKVIALEYRSVWYDTTNKWHHCGEKAWAPEKVQPRGDSGTPNLCLGSHWSIDNSVLQVSRTASSCVELPRSTGFLQPFRHRVIRYWVISLTAPAVGWQLVRVWRKVKRSSLAWSWVRAAADKPPYPHPSSRQWLRCKHPKVWCVQHHDAPDKLIFTTWVVYF
jgi:hypothetical protein